jgi:hypothetical protein
VKNFNYHPEALAEAEAAAKEYGEKSEGLDGKFYDAVEEIITEIRTHPEVFRQFDPPARRHFKLRWPYAVIYVDYPDRILIVAVMAFKQRPGYWKRRIPSTPS